MLGTMSGNGRGCYVWGTRGLVMGEGVMCGGLEVG